MNQGANRPIGIFDSGVGGLTVLRALRRLLPDEHYIYLGDTARLPYGTKSPETVSRYARHAADFLLQRDIKLLVVACNTASAVALDELRSSLAPLPVIGVVEPGAAAAVSASDAHRHLVLATEATTAHRAYTRAIQALQPDAQVEELPCSMFVALAEEGWHRGHVAEVVAQEYLGRIVQRPEAERPDTAILGCTHFPLVQHAIEQVLGPEIRIVDSAGTAAEAVRLQLAGQGALNAPGVSAAADASLSLVATDGAARFARIGSAFLGEDFAPGDIEIADIHPSDLNQ